MTTPKDRGENSSDSGVNGPETIDVSGEVEGREWSEDWDGIEIWEETC